MKRQCLLTVLVICGGALVSYAAEANVNWEEHCAKCHGADGKGGTKMGKKLGIRDYTDAKVQGDFTDDQAFKAIKEGLKDKNGKALMKAVEGLSDDEIKALVQHVRTLKS